MYEAITIVPPNRSLKQLEGLVGKELKTHEKYNTEFNCKSN